MQHTNYKWLKEPEKYYPEPKTLRNIIEWHCALASKSNTNFDYDLLVRYEEDYFIQLGYKYVKLIECAMLIGRELYYKKLHGYSEYEDELGKYDIRDLASWCKVFDVPETIEEGGNLVMAVEYTLSKIPVFLETYIKAVELLA